MRYDGGRLPARSISIVELIASGTLDAELAGLLWLLLEARVPIVVAAKAGRTGKSTLLEAILAFLPPGTRRQSLAGSAEDFEWLPEAADLGWRHAAPWRPPDGRSLDGRPDLGPAEPATTYLVAAELSNHLPTYTWGEQARVAVRAVSRGYGLGATIHADSLEEVFALLSGPAVGLTAEELSRLGLVLILRLVPGGQRRLTAGHYVRPVVRDAGGHVQRLGPAVLATWDPASDALDHFWWGILPELAERTGRRAGDFEAEQARRASYLAGLVAGGLMGWQEVMTAIAGYRTIDPSDGR
jgi:archaeal flagellar protein FlaI